MKKSTAPRKKAAAKAGAKPASEVHSMAQEVITYLESRAKNIDKATLAKYVAVAVLVIYGIRKSNILGSLTLSLITGVVSKFLAEKFEGHEFAELIPDAVKAK